jgi:hypothetical protein
VPPKFWPLHGDARVERLLWKRLERWSERWRGRAEELEIHPITGSVPNAESQLGPALFTAIASARSWVLDESRRNVSSGCSLTIGVANTGARNGRPAQFQWTFSVAAECIPRHSAWTVSHLPPLMS